MQPAYVLTEQVPSLSRYSQGLEDRPTERRLVRSAWTRVNRAAERAIHSRVRQLERALGGVPNLARPQVILDFPGFETPSEGLARYALTKQMDWILVSTRGLRGLARWGHRGFVEHLVEESSVPLLSVGPHLRPRWESGPVLFAVEFFPETVFTCDKTFAFFKVFL